MDKLGCPVCAGKVIRLGFKQLKGRREQRWQCKGCGRIVYRRTEATGETE